MKKILVGLLVATFLLPSLSYAATTDEIRLQLIQLIIQEIAMLETELASENTTATSTPAAQESVGGIGAVAPSPGVSVNQTDTGVAIDASGDFDLVKITVTRPDGAKLIAGGFNPATDGVYHYELHSLPTVDGSEDGARLVGHYPWEVTTRKTIEGQKPVDTVSTGVLNVQ